MKLAGVYRIENRINGKLYVGATMDLFRQKIKHLTDLENGKHINSQLQSDFFSYGAKVFFFEVLETGKDRKELIVREQYYIDQYGYDQLYNVAPIDGNEE